MKRHPLMVSLSKPEGLRVLCARSSGIEPGMKSHDHVQQKDLSRYLVRSERAGIARADALARHEVTTTRVQEGVIQELHIHFIYRGLNDNTNLLCGACECVFTVSIDRLVPTASAQRSERSEKFSNV